MLRRWRARHAWRRCSHASERGSVLTLNPCPSPQAVESQVNLEKLQQEAHAHNLHRKEVKELYQQVGFFV